MPAFSMMVRRPEDGDPAVAERIRAAAAGYTLAATGVSGLMEGDADGHEKVSEYRRMLAEMQQANGKGDNGEPQEKGSPAPREWEPRRPVSRRNGTGGEAEE